MHNKKPIALEAAAILLILGLVVWWLFFKAVNNPGDNAVPSPTLAGPSSEVPVEVPPAIAKAATEAVGTTVIDISQCSPKPAVATFAMTAKVRFVNNDAQAHQIFFSPDMQFGVPAVDSQTVIFDVWQFPGLRKYSCDGRQAVGSVYITK